MRTLLLALFIVVCSCGGPKDPPAVVVAENSIEVGPAGGELVPSEESAWHGVALKIPAGALSSRVTITLHAADDETPLPETAERVGPFLTFSPADTELSIPAELTVELDPARVAEFEQTPADCKVWMRDGDGWKRLEQTASTAATVTVQLPKLATVAAGVNASLKNVCLTAIAGSNCQPTLSLTPHTAVNPCQALTDDYCLLSLPQPESTRGLDEFASLIVNGRFVYWVKSTGDDDVTIGRYDLDNPGPVTELEPLTREASTTKVIRGRVALDGAGNVWAGIAGYGNVQFHPTNLPIEFDVQGPGNTVQPLGVLASPSGSIQRFRRITASGKSEARMAKGSANASELVFNYPAIPTENLIGLVRADNSVAVFRSLHRGASISYENLLPGDFRSVDFAQGGLGTTLDDDGVMYGAAAFHPAGDQVVVMKGSTLEFWSDADDFGFTRKAADFTVTLPVVPRDLTFGVFNGQPTNRMYAIAGGRREVYEVTLGSGMRTLPLPGDTSNLTPWRIVAVPNSSDLLLVTRGPLTKKGEFWLLRRLR
ncbi:MAG: hypothetical protein JNK82_30620 [Myxococcaceae bacterium]|nr:hypothetical protein [Myxococcaceae bacterium]